MTVISATLESPNLETILWSEWQECGVTTPEQALTGPCLPAVVSVPVTVCCHNTGPGRSICHSGSPQEALMVEPEPTSTTLEEHSTQPCRTPTSSEQPSTECMLPTSDHVREQLPEVRTQGDAVRQAKSPIKPPKPPRQRVSTPTSPEHRVHVTFNAPMARFEGLDRMPQQWKDVNRQFGVSMDEVMKVNVRGYEQKIPAILEMLRAQLVAKGGLETEGIFRLAPDKDKCDAAKEQINSGRYDGSADVHVVANLLKVWFREVRPQLFEQLGEAFMAKVARRLEPEQVLAEMAKLPECNRDLTFWLLDLMAAVVMNEDKTRMTARNIAIVLAPNLFHSKSENPLVMMIQAQLAVDFTCNLLTARLYAMHRNDVKAA